MPPLTAAPLDSATLNAVLQKQGMPNTTENLNRIAQFHAVAPDLLAQYLGQGTDAAISGANTNAAIDNSIAQTDPRLAQLAGPNPLTSTVDLNTGRSNIGPGLVRDTGNGGARRGTVTTGPVTKAPAGARGTSAVVEPSAMMPPPSRTAGLPSDPVTMGQTGQTGGTDRRDPGTGATDQPWALTDYIMLSVLGPAAYAAWRASRNMPPQQLPGGPPVTPQVGSGQVPTNRQLPAPGPENRPPAPPPNTQTRAPGGPGPGQTQADVDKMRAEVAAENQAQADETAAGQRRMQEEMRIKKAQEGTKKTLDAAGRVFRGGRPK